MKALEISLEETIREHRVLGKNDQLEARIDKLTDQIGDLLEKKKELEAVLDVKLTKQVEMRREIQKEKRAKQALQLLMEVCEEIKVEDAHDFAVEVYWGKWEEDLPYATTWVEAWDHAKALYKEKKGDDNFDAVRRAYGYDFAVSLTCI